MPPPPSGGRLAAPVPAPSPSPSALATLAVGDLAQQAEAAAAEELELGEARHLVPLQWWESFRRWADAGGGGAGDGVGSTPLPGPLDVVVLADAEHPLLLRKDAVSRARARARRSARTARTSSRAECAARRGRAARGQTLLIATALPSAGH